MPTPIFICGGECEIAGVGTVSAAVTEHWSAVTSTPTIVTAPASRGGMAIRTNPAGAARSLTHTFATAISSPATMVARFYLYFTTLPSGNAGLFVNNVGLGLYYTSSNTTLRGGSATGAQAASGITVTTGTWYRIDLKTVTNTTRTVDFEVDGVAATQYTLGSSAATNTTVVIGTAAAVTGDWYYDDIVVSGTSGDYPIGEGRVAGLYPDADGTHSFTAGNFEKEGTSSTAVSTTDTTSWQSLHNPLSLTVDNAKYIADTTGSNTAYVEYAFEDLPAAASVVGLNVVATNHAGGATANNCRMRLNDNGNTSGYVYGTAAPAYADLSETSIVCSTKAFATAPSTGSAWTKSLVDGLKVQWGLASDVAPDPFLDGVCLEVAYVEGTADATADAVAVTATTTIGTTGVARIGVTDRGDATNAAGTSATSASFSATTANLIVALPGGWQTGTATPAITVSSTFTDTGGGAWTSDEEYSDVNAGNSGFFMEAHHRVLGTTPGASKTVTASCPTSETIYLTTLELSDYDTADPIGGSDTAEIPSSGDLTVTLPSPPAADSLVIVMCHAPGGGAIPAAAGFTTLFASNFDVDTHYTAYRNGGAPTSVTFAGLVDAAEDFPNAALIIEIKASAPSGDVTANAVTRAVTTTRGTTVANIANTVTALTPTALDSAVFNSTLNTVTAQARTTVRGTPTVLTSSVGVAVVVAPTALDQAVTGTVVNTVTVQARTATISAASATVAATATALAVARTTTIGTATATGDAVATAISQARTTTIGTATATVDVVTTALGVAATTTIPLASASAASDATATALVVVATALDQSLTGSTANTVTGHGHPSLRNLIPVGVANTVTTVARTTTVPAVVGITDASAAAIVVSATTTTPLASASTTADAVADAVAVVVTALDQAAVATVDVTASAVNQARTTTAGTPTGSTANTVTAQARTATTSAVVGTGTATATALAVVATALDQPVTGSTTVSAPVVVVTALDSVASATGSAVAAALAVVASALDSIATATGTAVASATVVTASTVVQSATGSVTAAAAVRTVTTSVTALAGSTANTVTHRVVTVTTSAVTGTGTAVVVALAVARTATIPLANAIGEGTGTATAVFRVATATAPAVTGTGTAVADALVVARSTATSAVTGSTTNTVVALAPFVLVPLAVGTAASSGTGAALPVAAATSVSGLTGGAGGTVTVVVVTATLPQPQGGAGGITAALAVSVVCAAPSGGAGGTLAPATATVTTPLAVASGEQVVVGAAVPVGVAISIGPLLGGASGMVNPVNATVVVLGLIFFSGLYPGGIVVGDVAGPGATTGLDSGGALVSVNGAAGVTVNDTASRMVSEPRRAGGVTVGSS